MLKIIKILFTAVLASIIVMPCSAKSIITVSYYVWHITRRNRITNDGGTISDLAS